MAGIDIRATLSNRSVFITGATGFVGKALIEKLLRECKSIDTIFVLFRAKKDLDFPKRFADYKQSQVFERVRNKDPEMMEKLVPIQGDLMAQKMAGICAEDLEILISKVSVVLHCAASVRFDDTLKNALLMNTIGTKQMLDLAEKLPQLKAFIHCSTAFSNTNQDPIKEIVYEPVIDVNEVMEALYSTNEELLKSVNTRLHKIFPNTYVFSKHLAEYLVSQRTHLPVAIVRPSVICPAYKEPMLGWVDSNNGPMGVLVGASSGILRTVYGRGDIIPDLIPVDFVANTIIAAACAMTCSTVNELKVYNCISSAQMPITWNEFLDLGREIYAHYPSMRVIWYPGGQLSSNYLQYLIYFFLFQLIPACFLDLFQIIMRRPLWALKLQKKIFRSLKCYDYFMQHQWTWQDDNLQLLLTLLTVGDRYSFGFSTKTLDYRRYVRNWVIGSRRYILKLEDTTITEAKKKFMILYWLDWLVKGLFLLGCYYLAVWLLRSDDTILNVGCEKCEKGILGFL